MSDSYMKKRYHKIREEAIAYLGGECVICGSKDDLQLDHIFRSEKEFQISQIWSFSRETFYAELDKCQLLCGTCHRAKTAWEVGAKAGRSHHGTLTSYRYCKCDECRAAYSKYWETYKPRKKRAAKPALTVKLK